MAIVKYEKVDEHLVVISLNRPEKLNAINMEMMDALREAWKRYRDDDDAWIAIMTGVGKAFSAGVDKDFFDMALRGDDAIGMFYELTLKDPYWSGELDKPVIAAVNGLCIGAGLDLVLRSDLRVASEHAWFQQPEVARGNVMIFYDNLPYAMAAEMISGFKITAQRAYDVGMINRVVPEEKVMEEALSMAHELMTRVPLALYHALKLIREMKDSSFIVSRRILDHYTTLLSKGLTDTEDYREATKAFLEKREPHFRKG